jgi:hypothetical protein
MSDWRNGWRTIMYSHEFGIVIVAVVKGLKEWLQRIFKRRNRSLERAPTKKRSLERAPTSRMREDEE